MLKLYGSTYKHSMLPVVINLKTLWIRRFWYKRVLLFILVVVVSFQIHILFRYIITLPSSEKNLVDVSSYTVCNGMSNQILGHIASLTSAIYTNSSLKISNAFIVNGIQNIDRGIMKNKVPNIENSVSLSKIFVLDNIREFIKKEYKHRLQNCSCRQNYIL